MLRVVVGEPMRFWFAGPRFAGIRTGVSIGPEDFARARQPRSTAASGEPDSDKFLYVVRGGGLVKIGITNNPNARLAQLQSASTAPLDFAWIAAASDATAAIEREAHNMLAEHRRNGEWFEIQPDAAVGAISAAAYRRGRQLLSVTPERAEQIRQIGLQLATTKNQPSTALGRVAVGVLQLLAAFILAAAFFAFFAIRFARFF
jgi:Meiotically up-regulated gene 113